MGFFLDQPRRRTRGGSHSTISTVEMLEHRALLTAGITLLPAPTIIATPGVPLTNVTVATFTVDDPNSVPGDQRRGNIAWGDGTIDKRVVPSLISGNTFAMQGSHTYAVAGTYTITVKVAVPMMPSTINTVTLEANVTNPPPPPHKKTAPADLDGNGHTDLIVYNPSNAQWSIRLTNDVGTVLNLPFGTPNAVPLTGDFDGNGQSDLATFDPPTAQWTIRLTNNAGTILSLKFGAPNGTALVGDFDGNGQSDLAVFDPSTAQWSIRLTNNDGTILNLPFGSLNSIPLVGDLDGNGQSDLVVYDPSTAQWSIRLTNNVGTILSLPFGPTGAIPLLGDFDGNGHADLAVFQPATAQWSIRLTNSVGTTLSLPFGTPNSIPQLGDLDGNGQTDLVTFLPSTAQWSIRLTNSVGTTLNLPFGPPNTTPVLPATYQSTGGHAGFRREAFEPLLAAAATTTPDTLGLSDTSPIQPLTTLETAHAPVLQIPALERGTPIRLEAWYHDAALAAISQELAGRRDDSLELT